MMKKVVKYIKIIKKSVNNVTAERLFIIMSNKFIVETSARHVHLTQEHLEILFGKNAKLTNKKDLSQPGQFACEERVTIVGPKKSMPNVSILGPEGEVEISQGVIIAKRHIHLTPEDALQMNVKDKDIVWVKLDTKERKAILGDVVVRVSPKYAAAMHIDTDESNAVSAYNGLEGEIINI